MKNIDLADKHIKIIFQALSNGMSEQDIITDYLNEGWSGDDIHLLLTAGKILFTDLIFFIPPKPIFRRAP
jgi:hypothetical protein